MAGRYSKAIDYIDKRLSLTMRDDLQGLLLEWKAVAFSELRVEQSQVVQLFDEAIRLNPASESAIRNRNLFADSPSKPERSNGTEWQIETPNIGIEYSTLDLPKHKLPKPKFDLAA